MPLITTLRIYFCELLAVFVSSNFSFALFNQSELKTWFWWATDGRIWSKRQKKNKNKNTEQTIIRLAIHDLQFSCNYFVDILYANEYGKIISNSLLTFYSQSQSRFHIHRYAKYDGRTKQWMQTNSTTELAST